LVYLVQFLWPLFIVAIFWFLVYRIQKRLYSPSNILKRFLSDKGCPSCWNSVDFTKPFCPICSHEIQNHCPKCNELTIKWMPYCSSCGSKI
jgi:predicted amidophosphoribosyltransferase